VVPGDPVSFRAVEDGKADSEQPMTPPPTFGTAHLPMFVRATDDLCGVATVFAALV